MISKKNYQKKVMVKLFFRNNMTNFRHNQENTSTNNNSGNHKNRDIVIQEESSEKRSYKHRHRLYR